MENVRICRIVVDKLFGNISYNIDLEEDNPIAIITAPNGRGKTTILNLISFIFNPTNESFDMIKDIPFKSFHCELSNGKVVHLRQIHKNSNNTNKGRQEMSRPAMNEARLWIGHKRAVMPFESTDFECSITLGDGPVFLKNVWYSKAYKDSSKADLTEFIEESEDELMYAIGRTNSALLRLNYIWKKQIQDLDDEGCLIPINFIRADRIQPVILPARTRRELDAPRQKSPLELASENIRNMVKNDVENYSDAVSKAKDVLPQMFLDGEGGDLDCGEFMEGWSAYRNELNQFQEIGLITPTEDFTKGKDIRKVYPDKGRFLSTYLSAFKCTTAPLQDIYRRLSLLKTILDERNATTGKILILGRDGISLSYGDREIELDTLSSGEKHDFIMFYNLIFNVEKGGLVLIDEPEISLHIQWQETYLDKLIEICEMNGLHAIVATHSPNIVSSHYDFLVDKGEQDGRM